MTAAALTPLAFDEAQALFAEIRASQDNWMELVIKAHDQKAWIAVGYNSWAECVRQEFPISKRHANRLINYGKVYDVLAEVSGTNGPLLTESQARPLTALEPDDQRAAFTAAQEAAAAEGKPLAARHVEAAVEQIKPKPKRNGAESQLERDRLAAIARAVEPPPHGPGTISDAELDAGDGGDPVYLIDFNAEHATPAQLEEAISHLFQRLAPRKKLLVIVRLFHELATEEREQFGKLLEAAQ